MNLVKFLSISLTVAAVNMAVAAHAADSTPAATIINDRPAWKRLLGDHKLSLQWISWKYFGKVRISDNNGLLSIKGMQKGGNFRDNQVVNGKLTAEDTTGYYLLIDGIITRIDEKKFGFRGTIETKVSYLNNGRPCRREGEMTFRITGARKYWRLKEMNNPCDEAVDYVDIYFRNP